jgi:hypothetical protein
VLFLLDRSGQRLVHNLGGFVDGHRSVSSSSPVVKGKWGIRELTVFWNWSVLQLGTPLQPAGGHIKGITVIGGIATGTQNGIVHGGVCNLMKNSQMVAFFVQILDFCAKQKGSLTLFHEHLVLG